MINILTFYGTWILSSLIMNRAGLWVPTAWTVVFTYVFIITALFGLSFLTRQYQVRIEPTLRQARPLRLLTLASCCLIFICGYVAVSKLGVKSNLIIALHTANLLFFSCVLGHWLTTPLKRPAELIPLCLVMTFVDIYSVFKGPSQELTSTLASHYIGGQSGAPPMVDFILIKLPLPGQSYLMPVFGVADWIVIAMLSAAATKFNMNDNLLKRSVTIYFPVGAVGLIVTIMSARELGIYLPALPMIAAFFLIVMAYRSPEIIHLTRNELPAMILSTVVACGVLGSILL